jgi:hypothetical protein
MKKWSSHAVKSPQEIVHESSHPLGGHRTRIQANASTKANSDTHHSQSKRCRHAHTRHLRPRRPETPLPRLRQPLLRARRLRQRLLHYTLRRSGRKYPKLRVLSAIRHPWHGLRSLGDVPVQRGHVGQSRVVP